MGNVKKIGDKTEKKALEVLCSKGWRCHLFAYNVNGQPCDIVALKENMALLIDVKHCDSDYFPVSRIEPNQKNCFKYATTKGVTCGFALYNECDHTFYWLPWELVENLNQVKHFKLTNLKKLEMML